MAVPSINIGVKAALTDVQKAEAAVDRLAKKTKELDQKFKQLEKKGPSAELTKVLNERMSVRNQRTLAERQLGLLRNETSIDNIYDAKEALEEMDPMKRFKRGARDFFRNSKLGGSASRFLSNPMTQRAIGGIGLAGGVAAAGVGVFQFAAEFDRKFNPEAADLEDQIRFQKAIGGDTGKLETAKERATVEGRLGYRMTDWVAGEASKVPVVGGVVGSILTGATQTLKNIELDEAGKQSKEFDKITEGMSKDHAMRLRDRVISQQIDGGSGWWQAWRRQKENLKDLTKAGVKYSGIGLTVNALGGNTDALMDKAMYNSKEGQEILKTMEADLQKAAQWTSEAYKQLGNWQIDSAQKLFDMAAEKNLTTARDAVDEAFALDYARKSALAHARSLQQAPPVRVGG